MSEFWKSIEDDKLRDLKRKFEVNGDDSPKKHAGQSTIAENQKTIKKLTQEFNLKELELKRTATEAANCRKTMLVL